MGEDTFRDVVFGFGARMVINNGAHIVLVVWFGSLYFRIMYSAPSFFVCTSEGIIECSVFSFRWWA